MKMKPFKPSAFMTIALSVLFAAGCAKKGDDIQFGSADFLVVGNEIVYQWEDINSNSGTFTWEVTGTHPDYPEVYLVQFTNAPSGIPSEIYYFVDGTSVKTFQTTETIDQARKVYELGVSQGATWTVAATNYVYTVEEVNQPYIGAAIGTVNCDKVKIQFPNSFIPQYNYWAETHGQVAQESLVLSFYMESKNF